MSGIATAVVGSAVVTGYMSSQAQKKAASSAASAQTAAADASIAEQQRQFDKLQELLSPYVKAGDTALTAQQNLLGLGGNDAQAKAIAALQDSSQYKSLIQSGENAILQNASATGGLRGGNTQSALAQYSPQILSQLIESQYNKLGGLTQLGQASAAGVGSAGMSSANSISQLLQASGNAQAQAALASGAATANMWGTIGKGIGTAYGMGAF